MKQSLSSAHPIASATSSLQQKISLLCENGFVFKEIATITNLPKKIIKAIAKGALPEIEECARIEKIFDETISRLQISAELYNNNPCPESDLDTDDYECFNIMVKNISVYKTRDSENMIIQIHGSRLHE